MHAINISGIEYKRLLAQYIGFLRCAQWIPAGEDFDSFEVAADNKNNAPNLSLPQRHIKLGHLAEYFFLHWLEGQGSYEKNAAHLQIKRDQITLGEIDYLIYDRSRDQHLHVELAFKFYLLDPELDGGIEAKWIGPNRRDSFALKLDKLRQNQFPLLFRAETMEVLHTLGLDPKRFKQALCLKARLFVPEGYDVRLLQPAYQHLITGTWKRFQDFTADRYGAATFCIPDKNDWLIDPGVEINHSLFEWQTFDSTFQKLEEIISAKRSPMCFMKTREGCERFFVVWW